MYISGTLVNSTSCSRSATTDSILSTWFCKRALCSSNSMALFRKDLNSISRALLSFRNSSWKIGMSLKDTVLNLSIFPKKLSKKLSNTYLRCSKLSQTLKIQCFALSCHSIVSFWIKQGFSMKKGKEIMKNNNITHFLINYYLH